MGWELFISLGKQGVFITKTDNNTLRATHMTLSMSVIGVWSKEKSREGGET